MREEDSETSGVMIPSRIYRIWGSEALGRIYIGVSIDVDDFFTPDVSGSFSLTNRTLVMFLDVLKTFGDVFARFVKSFVPRSKFRLPSRSIFL